MLRIPAKNVIYAIYSKGGYFSSVSKAAALKSAVPRKEKISEEGNATTASPRRKMEVTNYIRTTDDQTELLKLYKQIHGDLLVGSKFVIPSSPPWPYWAYEYPLGALVMYLRQFHNKHLRGIVKSKIHPSTYSLLDSIGFVWNVHKNRHELVIAAFEHYKQLHGHVNVPLRFVVPSETIPEGEEAVAFQPLWPMELWGLKLGRITTNIRHSQDYKAIHPALEALGFSFNSVAYNFDDVFHSFQVYKSIHGDINVPENYSIPLDDPRFRPIMLGKPLGEIVRSIRRKNTYKEHHRELASIGFSLSPQHDYFETVFAATQAFKKRFGHVNVPRKFVIPIPENENDASKDSEENMEEKKEEKKKKKKEKEKEQKEEKPEAKVWTPLKTGPKQLDKLHPVRPFVKFPPDSWGMPLGKILLRVKYGDTLTRFQREFESLGFAIHQPKPPTVKFQSTQSIPLKELTKAFGVNPFLTMSNTLSQPSIASTDNAPAQPTAPTAALTPSTTPTTPITTTPALPPSRKRIHGADERFVVIFQALLVYKQQHGDLLVPRMYKIPKHDLQYPAILRGKCLGHMVYQLRFLPEFQKYQSQLLEIGFVYDLKYYEFTQMVVTACQTYESLFGPGTIHDVHFSFTIAEDDIRYPIQCRGMKLGQIVSRIRRGIGYVAYRQQFYAVFHHQSKRRLRRILLPLNSYPKRKWKFTSIEKDVDLEEEKLAEQEEFGDDISSSSSSPSYLSLSRDEKFAVLEKTLLAYKAIHGNLLVPAVFVVPTDDDRYPALMHGRALGNMLSNIRTKRIFQEPKYLDTLQEMGLMLTNVHHQRVDLIVKAIKQYRDCFNTVDIPYHYVVPYATPSTASTATSTEATTATNAAPAEEEEEEDDDEEEVKEIIEEGNEEDEDESNEDEDDEDEEDDEDKESTKDKKKKKKKRRCKKKQQVVKPYREKEIDENRNVVKVTSYSIIDPTSHYDDVPKVAVEFSKDVQGMKLGHVLHRIKRGEIYKRYAHRFRRLGIIIGPTTEQSSEDEDEDVEDENDDY